MHEALETIRKIRPRSHRLQRQFDDPQGCFSEATRLAIDLGLAPDGRRLEIASVGEGVPYLAAAASVFEHHVVAINSPDIHVDQAAAMLGVENRAVASFSLDGSDRLDSRYWFDVIVCMGSDGILGHSTFRDTARCVRALMRSIRIPTGRIVCAFDSEWIGGRWRNVSRWRRQLRSHAKIHVAGGRVEFAPKGVP